MDVTDDKYPRSLIYYHPDYKEFCECGKISDKYKIISWVKMA